MFGIGALHKHHVFHCCVIIFMKNGNSRRSHNNRICPIVIQTGKYPMTLPSPISNTTERVKGLWQQHLCAILLLARTIQNTSLCRLLTGHDYIEDASDGGIQRVQSTTMPLRMNIWEKVVIDCDGFSSQVTHSDPLNVFAPFLWVPRTYIMYVFLC